MRSQLSRSGLQFTQCIRYHLNAYRFLNLGPGACRQAQRPAAEGVSVVCGVESRSTNTLIINIVMVSALKKITQNKTNKNSKIMYYFVIEIKNINISQSKTLKSSRQYLKQKKN